MTDQTYYKDGYESTISQSHAWRTAENSCGYMLKYIKPTDKILDVGCGPGTITYDLSTYVPEGEIIGVEPTKELIDEALNNEKSDAVKNVNFQVASVFELPFPDNSFDIVHAHQVIIHLQHPVEALKEMRRVLRPDGYLCFKDAELRSTIYYPRKYEDPLGYYMTKIRTEFTSCFGGSRSKELALEAGFDPENIVFTSSNWTISSEDDRRWFSQMYINRLESLEFGKSDKYTREQLELAWKEWASDDNAVCILLHGEIVAKK